MCPRFDLFVCTLVDLMLVKFGSVSLALQSLVVLFDIVCFAASRISSYVSARPPSEPNGPPHCECFRPVSQQTGHRPTPAGPEHVESGPYVLYLVLFWILLSKEFAK